MSQKRRKKGLQILIFLIIGLVGLVIYDQVFKSEDPNKRQEMDYVFHYEDTASITRIYIKDKTPHEVDMIRTPEGWKIDGERLARQKAAQLILETVNKMRLKNFVPKKMKETVINRMATHGKEVKLYVGDELVRHFYVGTETMDEMGTYMMNHRADAPFAVFIPGFNGYLSSRFFANPLLWRDRTIWGYDNLEISRVRLEYPDKPEISFDLKTKNEEGYRVKRLSDGAVFAPDSINTGLYLASFRTLNYEGAIIETDGIWERRDSLKASIPVFKLRVEHEEGDWKELVAYHIKAAEDTEDNYGVPLEYDPDRMHAFLYHKDGTEDFLLVQYYGLARALIDIHQLLSR